MGQFLGDPLQKSAMLARALQQMSAAPQPVEQNSSSRYGLLANALQGMGGLGGIGLGKSDAGGIAGGLGMPWGRRG